MSAQENRIALPLRNHTIFGVCEAIGEDFGFNPVLLRVPFAASVLWSPVMAVGAYLVLGALVLLSRLLFPNPKQASAPAVIEEKAAVTCEQSEQEPELAEAA